MENKNYIQCKISRSSWGVSSRSLGSFGSPSGLAPGVAAGVCSPTLTGEVSRVEGTCPASWSWDSVAYHGPKREIDGHVWMQHDQPWYFQISFPMYVKTVWICIKMIIYIRSLHPWYYQPWLPGLLGLLRANVRGHSSSFCGLGITKKKIIESTKDSVIEFQTGGIDGSGDTGLVGVGLASCSWRSWPTST